MAKQARKRASPGSKTGGRTSTMTPQKFKMQIPKIKTWLETKQEHHKEAAQFLREDQQQLNNLESMFQYVTQSQTGTGAGRTRGTGASTGQRRPRGSQARPAAA
jgi:hypothetical protein